MAISVEEIYKVEAFKEKPNLETAEQYLAAGNYYWNAGIFVWNIDTISKAIRTFQAKPCQHHGRDGSFFSIPNRRKRWSANSFQPARR